MLDTSPLGYWRFNETDGDTAVNLGSAGSTLNGTYVGGRRSTAGPDQTQGQLLPRLEADNFAYIVGPDESYVNVNASPLNDLHEFSLAGWVRELLTNDRIGLFGQDGAIEFGFINPNYIQVWTPNGGEANYGFMTAICRRASGSTWPPSGMGIRWPFM